MTKHDVLWLIHVLAIQEPQECHVLDTHSESEFYKDLLLMIDEICQKEGEWKK